MNRIIVWATPFLLGGCVSTQPGMFGESAGVRVQDKIVASKVAPNILVATDRSTCEVSRSRWEEAAIGEPFRCAWQPRRVSFLVDGVVQNDLNRYVPSG